MCWTTHMEGVKETVWDSLVTLALSHAVPPESRTKTPWLWMELRSNLNRVKYSPLAGGLVDFVWFGWHGLKMKLQLNILCNFVCILNCVTLRLWKCCTQYASKFGKVSRGHRTGKGQFSFQFQRKAMPKNVQTTTQLHSSHMVAK